MSSNIQFAAEDLLQTMKKTQSKIKASRHLLQIASLIPVKLNGTKKLWAFLPSVILM